MPPLSREEIAKHLQITLEELAAIIEGNKFPSDVQRWKILELFIMKTGNGGIATDPQFLEMRRVIEKKFPDAVFMSVDELLELSDMIEFASVTGSKLLRTHPTDRAKFLAFREKRAERVNALEIAVEKLRLALTKEQPKYKDDELFSEVLSRAFQFLNQTTIQAPNHYIKAIIKKNRGRNLNSWIYKHSNEWIQDYEIPGHDTLISLFTTLLHDSFKKAEIAIASEASNRSILPSRSNAKRIAVLEKANKMKLHQMRMRQLISFYGYDEAVAKIDIRGGKRTGSRPYPFWELTSTIVESLLVGEKDFGDAENENKISPSMALKNVFEAAAIPEDAFIKNDDPEMIRVSGILRKLKNTGISRNDLAKMFGLDIRTLSELISTTGRSAFLLKSKAAKIH